MEHELDREMPEGHVLVGRSLTAVAVRRHLKDAVFWLPETGEWALVHLTRRVEKDPRWPSALVTADWRVLADEMT